MRLALAISLAAQVACCCVLLKSQIRAALTGHLKPCAMTPTQASTQIEEDASIECIVAYEGLLAMWLELNEDIECFGLPTHQPPSDLARWTIRQIENFFDDDVPEKEPEKESEKEPGSEPEDDGADLHDASYVPILTETPLQRLQCPTCKAAFVTPLQLRAHDCVNPHSWVCLLCTIENSRERSDCHLCGAPYSAIGSWVCTMCMLINTSSATRCEVCHAPTPVAGDGEGNALSQLQDSLYGCRIAKLREELEIEKWKMA